MGKISTYSIDGNVTLSDKLIGSDAESTNATKNYLLSDIYNLFASQLDPQEVVGSPIFQPDVITYSGTTAGGIGISLGEYSPIVFWSRQILAPNLVTVYGTIYMEGSGSYGDPILNTISLPSLETVSSLTDASVNYSLYISNFPYLQTLNLSSLRVLYNSNTSISLTIEYCPLLTTLNLSNLERVDSRISIFNNIALTTLDISSLTTFDSDFDGSVNAFTQVTVDAILDQLANVVGLANKSVDLSGGTNAAPSVTGAGYVATLVSNGCTVTTN